jgi:hypothetical protein
MAKVLGELGGEEQSGAGEILWKGCGVISLKMRWNSGCRLGKVVHS